MKVIRWLRSRPLARVRRNLATEKRIRARLASASYTRAAYRFGPATEAILRRPPILPHGQGAYIHQGRVVLHDGPIDRARGGLFAPGSEHLRQLQEDVDG